ncbi:hypothetical protein Q676_04480 [Escherichia coli N40607]|nr:hypothetical protein Q676_04480 [Escherichia coli N40607]
MQPHNRKVVVTINVQYLSFYMLIRFSLKVNMINLTQILQVTAGGDNMKIGYDQIFSHKAEPTTTRIPCNDLKSCVG